MCLHVEELITKLPLVASTNSCCDVKGRRLSFLMSFDIAKAVLQTGKRMVKEIAQQLPGAPYAAGSSIKPQTTYQRFCSTALVQ